MLSRMRSSSLAALFAAALPTACAAAAIQPATPRASPSGPTAWPPLAPAAASAATPPPIPSASTFAASAASPVATPAVPSSTEPPPLTPAFQQAVEAANKAIAVERLRHRGQADRGRRGDGRR